MANEAAVCIVAPKILVTRVCAEATAIPRGTVMKLTGTNTVAASAADNDPFGGITIEEFKGGEGLTHVTCAMDGTWDMYYSGAVGIGVPVAVSGANAVNVAAEADFALGNFVGFCEEIAGGAGIFRTRVTHG
jgi:hypothetical protein